MGDGKGGKSKRTARLLRKKEPKLVENTKNAMFIKGPKTSELVVQLLRDLHELKKPEAVMYNRKNQIRPFEDETQLEFFSQKSDCSLFAYVHHQKKRPHCLTLGRLFDHHILDMMEININPATVKSIQDFPKCPKSQIGNKPCFVFKGEEFENDLVLKKFRSLIVDFFRGFDCEKINLVGLDHVIVCTAKPSNTGTIINFTHYFIHLMRSGSSIPRVELEEMGPSFEGTIGRTKFASHDLEKIALKRPRELMQHKKKNLKTNTMKETIATLHMERQDLNEMALKKMKGLKRDRKSKKTDEKQAESQDVNGNTKNSRNSSDTGESRNTPNKNKAKRNPKKARKN